MSVVARIEVPPPEPFCECEEGARAEGAGYRFIAPRTATEPLVFQAADGHALFWTPTELVFGDGDGQLDFIAGSAPAAFTVRGRSVHYPRTFPASEEVHVATPEGRKYWLYLYEPPRQPAPYLSGDLWFGVAGMVGGIPLPPGRHVSMESDRFRFQPVYAEDTMGARVEGWYEVVNTDEGQQLFICVPAKWLLAPERVYPVKLDPTITLSDTNRAFYPPSGNCVVTLSDGRKIALLAVTMNKKQFFISSDNGETWAPLLDYPRSVNMNVYTEHATCLAVNDLDQVFVRSNKYLDMLTIDANGTPTLTQLANDLPVAERRLFVWRDDNRTILVALKGDGTYLRLNVYAVEADGTLTSIQSTTPFSFATDGEVGAMHSDRSIWVAGRSGSSTYSTEVQKMVWDGSKYVRSGDVETVFKSSNSGIAVDAEGRPLVVVSPATFSRQVMRRSLTGEWENLGFPASQIYAQAIFCDGNDIYVVYIDGSDRYIYLSKWDEAAKTWNTAPIYEGQVETAASVSVEKRDGNQANSVVILYKVGNEVRSYTHTFNQPPKQPTHLDRQPFDATEDAVFRWQYNDDPGDGQSAYHLQIRLSGSDTDLVDTGEVQSPVSEHLLPGGTLENGRTYQWRVRTADQSGEWSPWSDYAVFQTGPKPQATILYPTEGTTVSTAEVTVEWSVPSQSRATVRLYDETGQTVLQEHEVTTPSARRRTITGLENHQSYQVSVQVTSASGVVGDEAFSGVFNVVYTPPLPAAGVSAVGDATLAAVKLRWRRGWSRPGTFSRSSVAYLPDGTEVGSGQPRYYGGGIIVEEGTTNLLTANQSSLEDGATAGLAAFFNTGGSATIVTTTEEALHGARSLKVMTGGGGTTEGFTTSSVPITPSQTYTASAWVKGSGKVRLYLQERDVSDASISSTLSDEITLTNEWQRITVTRTFGATAGYARVLVLTSGAQAVTFYADCLQLENKPYATSWVLGGTTRSIEGISVPVDGITPNTDWCWRQWVYVGPAAKRKISGHAPTVFCIRRGGQNIGVRVYYDTVSSGWRLQSRDDDDILTNSPLVPDSDTPNGWHLFEVKYKAADDDFHFLLDGVLRASITANPRKPSAFVDVVVGSSSPTSATTILTALHGHCQLLNYCPPPEDSIAAYQRGPNALAWDDHTLALYTWANTLEGGTQEAIFSHWSVERSEDGATWKRIAVVDNPDSGDWVKYFDRAVGSGVVYKYRVRAVGANGTYTDSDPVQASVTYDEWRFSPVDGQPEIRFRFDSSVTWRPEEDVQVPRTMSRYQRTYRNPSYPRVATIQARFRDGEDGLTVREQRERLLQYIEQGVVGWLRGPHGDCWRGVLLQSQVQPSPHFARETVACVFRETREAP